MFDASQKQKLLEIFKDVPKRKKEMQQIVEVLEDKSTFACYYYSDQYQAFCEEYTIKLIQLYVRSEDEQQILLATYQLLDGYNDEIGVTERRKRYISRAAGNNKLIESDWATPSGSLQKIEKRVVVELVERLIAIVTDNQEEKGWLNLADTVKKELSERFPDGLPKELPLPLPSYLAPAPTSQRGRMTNLPPVEELFPTAKEIILVPGEIFQLKVAVLPKEAVDAPLSYVSLDPSTVTVSMDGMLKAEEKKQKLLHNVRSTKLFRAFWGRGEQSDEGYQTAEIVVQAESGVTAAKLIAVDYSKGNYKSPVDDINDFVPGFVVMQKIRLAGAKEWFASVDAKIGDTVEIQIQYKNIGEVLQEDVMIRDVLPPNLDYISETTKIYNAKYDGSILSDGITEQGVNLGNYTPGSNAYVRFSAKIVDVNLAPGSNTLVNWSQAGVGPVTLNDYATVVVQK